MDNTTTDIERIKNLRKDLALRDEEGILHKVTLTIQKKIFKTRYNLNISISYLSLIERGLCEVWNPEIIKAFSDFYQLSPEELFPYYRDKIEPKGGILPNQIILQS